MDAPVIYVVDDDKDMRHSLEWLFRLTGYQVKTFDCAVDFLQAYANGPGCLILDINLPGISGLALAEDLNKRKINLPVIIITGQADIPTAVSAMKAGAIDFIPKPFDGSKLIDLVQTAILRSLQSRDRRKLSPNSAARQQRLTPREREVMQLLVSGKSNKEIALTLNIGVRTVETHRAVVMRKLDVKSLAELVRLAVGGADGQGGD